MCYQKPLSCFILWRGKEKTALQTRIPCSSHTIPLLSVQKEQFIKISLEEIWEFFWASVAASCWKNIRSTWQGWSRCFPFQCCLDRVILIVCSTSREVWVCTREQWDYRGSIEGGKLSPGGFGAQHLFLGCSGHLQKHEKYSWSFLVV